MLLNEGHGERILTNEKPSCSIAFWISSVQSLGFPENAWATKVALMDSDEWDNAKTMIEQGHEIVNNSWNGAFFYENWQWFYQGDRIYNLSVVSTV